MDRIADLALNIVTTGVAMLVAAWLTQAIVARFLGFHSAYWRFFLALFAANIVASFVLPVLLFTWVLTPGGDGQAQMLLHFAIHFAFFYFIQVGAILLIVKDGDGQRIPTGTGIVAAAIPIAISVVITAMFWFVAI